MQVAIFTRWTWLAIFLLVAGCNRSPADGPATPTGPASTPAAPPAPAPQPEAPATARYRVVFDATWTAATHPQDSPSNPHFSPPIGATHTERVLFWAEGSVATNGIRRMAEQGATTTLADEIQVAIAAGAAEQVFIGQGFSSPKAMSLEFTVGRGFPLLTLVTMVAPSPDWFTGVSGLQLIENGAWIEDRTVPAAAWDAGTDSGVSFTSPDHETIPRLPITRIVTPPLGSAPLGTFRITRIG